MVSDVSVPDGIVTFKEKRGLRDFFRSLPSGQYVVKPTHGGHGWGVTAVSIESGKVTNLFGQSIDLDEFYLQCNDNRYNSSGFLFQEFVRPHRMLKQIMPGPALGTFRIVTFLSGDKSVNIPYAVVKIPVGSNVTDNFDAGSSGNWVCPVDVNTGGLGNAVGRSDSTPVVSERERHLDTGAVFREIEVPCWKEVKSTIIRAARVFADLRTLGWDVAITDDGASILEANWAWGENIIEVAQNRGLKSELIELTERSLLSASGEGN